MKPSCLIFYTQQILEVVEDFGANLILNTHIQKRLFLFLPAANEV